MKSVIKMIICFITLISFSSNALEQYPQHYTTQDSVYLNKIIKKNKSLLDTNHALKDIGIAYHQLAFIKTEGASKLAVEYLDKYIETYPDDMLALAYLGSSYTMLARDTGFKLKQLYYVNKSLDMLDKAAERLPNNYVVRLIRGNVSYAVPKIFDRRKIAFIDYKYLIDNFKFNEKLLSMLYYRLGILSKEDNQLKQANNYFESAIKASKKSKSAQKAKEELKK